jgi:L-ascorbate metabolism protein UlaG (beta-lactamase superfamily)
MAARDAAGLDEGPAELDALGTRGNAIMKPSPNEEVDMQSAAVLPDNTIWHLIHSSFLLKLKGIVMLFDYYTEAGTPADAGLDSGVIVPAALAGEEVYVIASHGHADHFDPVVFDWKERIPGIHYILSYDIPAPPEYATVIKPGEHRTVGNIRIRSYPSTDDGLAYSIYTGGMHVYFSGDNAFWNWVGDLGDGIYARIALGAIDRETPMDIAFQVCDPRLDGMGDGGIHIFARDFKPTLLVPIHSFGEYGFNAVAEQRLRQQGFTNEFWCVRRRGEMARIGRVRG